MGIRISILIKQQNKIEAAMEIHSLFEIALYRDCLQEVQTVFGILYQDVTSGIW